jgi:hypothetical protein
MRMARKIGTSNGAFRRKKPEIIIVTLALFF